MKYLTKKQIRSFIFSVTIIFGMVSFNRLTVSAETGIRPEDGVTQEQPFASGTGGSMNFRIPCMVTLDDGTIVAGCDARWTTTADGGGLDTIVSYSKDGGKTWNYTFANYLGDNGNVGSPDSTAFIDPSMATDGESVYMIADLFPAGIALGGATYKPQTGHTGYDANHNLALAAATDSVNGISSSASRAAAAFEYHIEKIEGAAEDAAAYYQLKDSEGNDVTGYTIDAFFNIQGNGVDTNLFCGDSPYFPYPTNFLYMTKSEDGGATWSIPVLIDIKKASEQTLLVGPGSGTVTSDGRIVFAAYEHTSGDKNTCVFYSDDQGATWSRGASVDSRSSEGAVTEADGKLFMFTRHGGYYVSEDGGATWSAKKEVGLTYNLSCELTAITYSEKIDGKTAILFAAPSDTGSRRQGKIFVGLVQEDDSIDWAYEYRVNSGTYAYSCLVELTNGDIGLLYEGGSVTYTSFALGEILGKLKFVEVEAGSSYTIVSVDAAADPVITTDPDAAIATVTTERVYEKDAHVLYAYTGIGTSGSAASYFDTVIDTASDLASAEFTITESGDYWTVYNESQQKYLDIHNAEDQFSETAYAEIVFEAVEDGCFRIRRNSSSYSIMYFSKMKFDRYSILDTSVETIDYAFTLLKAKNTVDEGDIIPGYEKATAIESGSKYLITYIMDDSVLIFYPAESGQQQKLYGGITDVDKSIVRITGVAGGTTTAVISGMEYVITVIGSEVPVEPVEPVHEHTWSDWTAKSEATVFEKATETRTCAECGEAEIREVGEVLKATITTNARSNKITLKKNRKSTGFQITGLAKGDSIASIKSSNTKVVEVSRVNAAKGTCTLKAGKLTGSKGKATITITLKSGLTKKIKVVVQKTAVKTTAIENVSKKLTLAKGKSVTLKPVLVPFTSQDKVKYTSNKKSVATVSSKGQIKAKKKGSATITVKAGKKTVRVKVTVK